MTNTQTTQLLEKYKSENIQLKEKLKKKNEINSQLREKETELYKRLKNQKDRANFDISKLKEALLIFDTKNKRLFTHLKVFEEILTTEDKFRISKYTVLLALEYMIFYKKVFEMYVFDYIVDRQNPDNKTDKDTEILIKTCKIWTNSIISETIENPNFNPKMFIKKFNDFTSKYVESNAKSE